MIPFMSIFGQGYNPNNGGQRSGLSLRLIAGIVIVLFGVISYYAKTSTNPTTGQSQHVGDITPQQETAMGLQAAPEMTQQMGGEEDANSPGELEVKKIGAFLVANSIAAKSPYQYTYHLLRDTQTVNAFALPGGQVFITRGLYDKLGDEAMLAGVLGHETGHVIERHSAQQMAKGQLGQTIVTGIGVAGSDRNNGYSAAMIAQMVNNTFQLKFSREHESEADAVGLRVMTEAGFDPQAMIDVMKVLETVSGSTGRQPEFMVTHPYPEHRIEAIQQWLKDHPDDAKKMQRGAKLH